MGTRLVEMEEVTVVVVVLGEVTVTVVLGEVNVGGDVETVMAVLGKVTVTAVMVVYTNLSAVPRSLLVCKSTHNHPSLSWRSVQHM